MTDGRGSSRARFLDIFCQLPRRAIALIGVLALLIIWVDHPVVAQDDGLEEFRSWATYEFGKEMHLNLETSLITQASELRLYVTSNGREDIVTTQVDLEEDLSQASHTLDLTQIPLAPYSKVVFWWEIIGDDGQIQVLPETTFDYLDDQFQWRKVKGEGVEINWVGEDNAKGISALRISEDVLAELSYYLPNQTSEPFRVFIYPQISDLQASLRLTGREWVGAHAQPELGVILVAASNPQTAATDLARDISHEMTHLLMYQVLNNNYDEFPRWLEEGLATNFEPVGGDQYQEILRNALETNTTLDFVNLCRSFPTSDSAALIAYAQSESFVQFIQSEYGEFAPVQMIKAVIDGASCEEVTDITLGLTLADLSQRWLEANARPNFFERLVQGGGIWLLIILAGFAIFSLIIFGSSKKYEG